MKNISTAHSSTQLMKRKITNNTFFSLLIASILLTQSCKLADIRTDYSKTSTASAKGKEILRESAKAMNAERLLDYNTYSVTLEDQFYGIVGKVANPYNENSPELAIDYVPGKFIGKMQLMSGKKHGSTYFNNEGKTFYKSAKGKTKEENKVAEFWVPTYQYFLELPTQIQRASIITYAGDTAMNGIEYDLVIASWNSLEPQKDIDQYLIWINKETKHLDYAQFTIRDVNGFAIATAMYKDYIQKDGLSFPSIIAIHGKKHATGKIHEIRIKELAFNKVDQSTITAFK